MRIDRRHLGGLLLAGALGLSAFAQDKPTAGRTSDMTNGEVRKIDRDTRRITLRHDEIQRLEMPAMTMVFRVRDPALLDKVQVGDRVRFRAEDAGTAQYVIEIEVVR